MSKIILGDKPGDGKFSIDLPRLVETRMLIQANSGGGKSYVIRKLLEEAHGKIQEIVLDVEGEFGSLREKFDFILAGKGGDVPADPKTAELLATKLLELEADCIIDLYELKAHERHRFVRLFLESLMNAPKNLWHPVLVIVDEAHLFAPEKGQSEAMSAVIDLATRGRKREFAAVLATQRISKLHKDAAAECLNKMIGRTGLDIDMKRAGDELGFTTKEQHLSLRDLDPGQFFSFGPAITKSVAKVQIGEVQTKHGKAARKLLEKNPAPTSKVKQVLAKLADLPKEAERELRDRESMTKRIRELERELRAVQKAQPTQTAAHLVERAKSEAKIEAYREFQKLMTKLGQLKNRLQARFKEIGILIDSIPDDEAPTAGPTPPAHTQSRINPTLYAVAHKPAKVEIEGRTFGQCERKILGFLSLKPGEYFTKVQVGALTGYSHGSGGFSNALSNLSQAGLILRKGGSIALNPEADVRELVDSTPHRLEDWIQKLGACERKIYEHLLSEPNAAYSKDELGQMTGYSAGSGGFSNSLSHLNTLGLIKRHHDGRISLNPEVSSL